MKKMTADEMFKKLGYDGKTVMYIKDVIVRVEYRNMDKSNWITITPNDVQFVKERASSTYLPIELIKPIKKFLEEQEWGDVRNKG